MPTRSARPSWEKPCFCLTCRIRFPRRLRYGWGVGGTATCWGGVVYQSTDYRPHAVPRPKAKRRVRICQKNTYGRGAFDAKIAASEDDLWVVRQFCCADTILVQCSTINQIRTQPKLGSVAPCNCCGEDSLYRARHVIRGSDASLESLHSDDRANIHAVNHRCSLI